MIDIKQTALIHRFDTVQSMSLVSTAAIYRVGITYREDSQTFVLHYFEERHIRGPPWIWLYVYNHRLPRRQPSQPPHFQQLSNAW